MTSAPFPTLVARLRSDRLPSWRVYDPRFDPFRVQIVADREASDARRVARGWNPMGPLAEPYCRDAWVLSRDEAGWYAYRGWRAEREEIRFDDEAAACDALYELVAAEHRPGVRALDVDELPLELQLLRRVVGHEPSAVRVGETLVTSDGSMGYRLVEEPDCWSLWFPSLRPPTAGDEVFRSSDLGTVHKVLAARIAVAMPAVPGVPRWGVPSIEVRAADPSPLLERWRHFSLERIVAAYLGAPDGVLVELGGVDALDLLTDGIVALAATRHMFVVAAHDPNSVTLGAGTDGMVALRRDGLEFVLSERRERSNSAVDIGRYPTLRDARAAVVAYLQ
jgi:hypothetical protein